MGLIPALGRYYGEGQPTPVFLPGEPHGQRSLEGHIHRVTKSQTRLKLLSFSTTEATEATEATEHTCKVGGKGRRKSKMTSVFLA